MATASSRQHLINQLSRKGRSSPSEEEFATASSFDAARDAIHSTLQLPEDISQQVATEQPHSTHKPLNLVNMYNKNKNFYEDDVSEIGSTGSADMSIELGRGAKKSACAQDPDISSEFVLNTGNGSFYEVTGTPPLYPRDNQPKNDDGLRRHASNRRAAGAESVKANAQVKPLTSMKGRSLAEALKQIGVDDDSTSMAGATAKYAATANKTKTRFTRAKQVSASEPADPAPATSAPAQSAPCQAGGNNSTAQSNSFVLPNLSNLNELVAGAHKDGTPVKTRTTSGSRFTSASYKATQQEHHRVGKLAVPEEEKAIYASLQLLKSQSEHLEMELAEARKRNEEFESEIIDLRSQLTVIHRRPDSALGSDDDVSDHELWQKEKKGLQASVKALQDRHDRSERKISVTEIAAKRVTKERDQLMSELAAAYCTNEELKAENAAYKESHGILHAENAELKDEVDALRKENQDLRLLMAQTEASYEHDALQREKSAAALKYQAQKSVQNSMQVGKGESETWQAKDSVEMSQEIPLRSRKEGRGSSQNVRRAARPKPAEVDEEAMQDDLAKRIAEEIQKHREASAAKSQASLSQRASQEKITSGHSRSKSDTQQQLAGSQRKTSTARRPVSAPAETATLKRPSSAPIPSSASDAESTTQLDFSQHTQSVSREPSLPTMIKTTRPAMPQEEDSRDLTLLSWQDPEEVLNLRKKLEKEHRAGSLKGTRSESGGRTTPPMPDVSTLRKEAEEEVRLAKARNISSTSGEENANQPAAPKLPLKSSLKDDTVGIDDPSTRFTVNGQTYVFPKVVKSIEVSDVGDISNMSNTSRRRRRSTASAEGMTSDFIVPDITFDSADLSTADTATMAYMNEKNKERERSFNSASFSMADSATMAYIKNKTEQAEVRAPSPVNVEYRAPSPTQPTVVEAVESRKNERATGGAPSPVKIQQRVRYPTPHPVKAVEKAMEMMNSPTPVSDREDLDDTTATIRPAQHPPVALATVIKQLQAEIKHLKINLAVQQRAYAKHDPSISKRKRVSTKGLMDKLTAEIEKRSDQVYALYDVLEGQKEAAAKAKKAGKQPTVMDEQQVEDTLSSLGIDPSEFSKNIAIERESQEVSWDRI